MNTSVYLGQLELTHRFELFFVEFAAVEEVRVEAVARPGRLDGCGRHVHEVLERERRQEARRRINTGHRNPTTRKNARDRRIKIQVPL